MGLVIRLNFFIPDFSVTIRRLHDIGSSAKWALPLVIVAVFNTWTTWMEPINFKGQAAGTFLMLFGLILVILFVVYAIMMFFMMIREGDRRPNQYGLDPKSKG